MGLFSVGCKVENPADPKKTVVVPKLTVDTGSEYTWIGERTLQHIGIEPRKKDLLIQLANGQVITRSVGFAVLHVDRSFTVDEVVFAQRGDLLLLGARALEGLGLQVDSRHKRLVTAGPALAATAIRPHVAARMGVIVGPPPKPARRRTRKKLTPRRSKSKKHRQN